MVKIIKFINKIIALGKRDFLIWISYRFALVLQVLLITGIVIFCYFVSNAMNKTHFYSQIVCSNKAITAKRLSLDPKLKNYHQQ